MCGNVVTKHIDSGVQLVCCGEEMEELLPKDTESGGTEKHLPVVTRVADYTYRVDIGSVEHPMLATHHIEFIYLETDKGGQVVYLRPDDKPTATFHTTDRVRAAYAFCNLHGLWKIEVN